MTVVKVTRLSRSSYIPELQNGQRKKAEPCSYTYIKLVSFRAMMFLRVLSLCTLFAYIAKLIEGLGVIHCLVSKFLLR